MNICMPQAECSRNNSALLSSDKGILATRTGHHLALPKTNGWNLKMLPWFQGKKTNLQIIKYCGFQPWTSFGFGLTFSHFESLEFGRSSSLNVVICSSSSTSILATVPWHTKKPSAVKTSGRFLREKWWFSYQTMNLRFSPGGRFFLEPKFLMLRSKEIPWLKCKKTKTKIQAHKTKPTPLKQNVSCSY